VRLFKISIENDLMCGKIFNVGSGIGISIKQVVEIIAECILTTKFSFKEWPKIDEKIETGNYISDINLLKKEIGWQPTTSVEEGIRKTIKFYDRK
jgi:UDP-glucose 4-epimerase